MSEHLKLRAVIHTIHPRSTFRTARGARNSAENVFVELSRDGVTGYGEASPNAYYNESAQDVLSKIHAAREVVAGLKIQTVKDIERAWHDLWSVVYPSRAALCALDVALWDLLAKQEDVTVSELAHGKPAQPVKSFCSLGITEPAELDAKIAELHGFPFVKIKCDAHIDITTIARIREGTGATLSVDANCSWLGANFDRFSRQLAECGVAFIEQPLPPAKDDRMLEVSAKSILPIFADESCVTANDVDALVWRFAGFNVKLVKCGGLTPALAMIKRGGGLGLRTMVGCMLESSLLVAAGAVVGQQTEFADLDGAWLLADDPFAGLVRMEKGILTLSEDVGFGVSPSAGMLAGFGG